MGHVNSVLMAVSKCPNPTVFQKTLGVNDFYFGSKDFEYPMGHISFVGKLDAVALSAGAPPLTPGFTLDLMAKHSLDFWLTSEDLPSPDNRVTLDREGNIELRYTPNNERGPQAADRDARTLRCSSSPARSTGGPAIRGCSRAASSSVNAFRSRAWRIRTARPLRPRSAHVGARSDVQVTRARQPLRRRWQLLSVERRSEPGADDRGERAARGRPPARKDELMRRLAFAVVALSLLVCAVSSDERADASQRSCESVERVGMTVSNMERSVAFFSNVLTFEKVSDEEVAGSEYERLQGVFGLRMRIVRMRLGDEEIELTEYLAPRGRPVPVDSRSNDRWFQHVAIIVSDMDAAYARLRQHHVEHASPEPQRLPDWNPNGRRHQGVLLQGSRRPSARDPAVPGGQGRSKVAHAEPAALPRHRPHRDRRRRYRDEPDASIATCWAFASLARAPTTDRSRSA